MGHSAAGRHAEQLVGNGAGRALAAADKGRPCAGDGSVGTLGPAGAEFQHHPALRGPDDAVGLGGDEALVIEDQQQEGLHQLGLNGRGPDGDYRLPGEDGRTLRNGPDIAGKPEIPQIIQELFRKEVLAPEIVNILFAEMQVFNIGNDPVQARTDGVAAVIRDLPEKDVKVGNPVLKARLKIAVAHGQLIKVAEHGHIELIRHIHCRSPFSSQCRKIPQDT